MSMASYYVRCFIHGRDTQWEAICTDLDIAVHASSENEVRTLLSQAIDSYVEDAAKESAATRARLMSRRSPFHVRLALSLRAMWYSLHSTRKQSESFQSVTKSCHA
jgi:hypothetical protein